MCYNEDMQKIDLSVGVTAHDEGYLAHKTLRCIFECMKRVEGAGYSFEIVINVDRGDDTTKEYLKQYRNDARFVILDSDFGDLGLSRNNITKNARGRFLAFIDADDLVSFNWYTAAIERLLESEKPLILHPAKELIFGTDLRPVCCNIHSSFDKAGDAMILAGCNRWTSTVLGLRKTFLKYPYMETGGGYGYEDYFFNTETIAGGVRHEIVPDTVMFYRRKKVSLLSRSDADKVIQPYTKLLDMDFLKTIKKPKGAEIFENIAVNEKKKREYEPTVFSKKLPRGLQKPYLVMRNNRKMNTLIIPIAKGVKRIVGYEDERVVRVKEHEMMLGVPSYLIDAWKDMNQIEPQLYPSSYVLKHELSFYYTDGLNRKVGPALWYLAQDIPKLPDYIFIVPWIIPGGSEKVLLNYVEALKRVHPEWTIAVVTTEKSKNTWKDKLGENAYLVDFGNVASKLDKIEKDFLFSRLITQLKAKRLHVIQSDYGYKWLADHAKLIKANYHVNVSAFCNGFVEYPDGATEVCGYIDPRLFEVFSIVENIFTDNYSVIDYIRNLDGYVNDEKFKVHYQPVEMSKVKERVRDENGHYRILWASRISRQKQPEMINEVARILENKYPGKYKIDVYGEVDREDYKTSPIERNAMVERKGGFSSFADLPTNKYDVFLYTAKYDGLPNVLIEAASQKMPIVASNVGGIAELIGGGRGILVEDYKSAEEFARAVERLCKDKKMAAECGDAAYEAVKKQHSFVRFDKIIKKDIR